MNRIVIIGNGFDMAHGLNTSYAAFIEWYWKQFCEGLRLCTLREYGDELCSLAHDKRNNAQNWMVSLNNIYDFDGYELIKRLIEISFSNYTVKISEFLKFIMDEKGKEQNWADLERAFYSYLKKIYKTSEKVQDLNKDIDFLRTKLLEYLDYICKTKDLKIIDGIQKAIYSPIYFKELSVTDVEKSNLELPVSSMTDSLKPDNTLLLSFNYTDTIRLYKAKNVSYNYIHGQLSNPNTVIFGYGDEIDESYKTLVNVNNNDILKNIKSIRYLESNNYRQLMMFMSQQPFQVVIMGHSCGNSDRTLLSRIFEHKNCFSIKPYYYNISEGSDNYMDIVTNIYRNFRNVNLQRERVVNKLYCEPLPQYNK